MHDIVIIGAGPGGLTAAIYALRANKSVLVLEKESFGGQITYSPKVENYPGFNAISGSELGEKLVDQVLALGAEIELDTVTGIKNVGAFKIVQCEHGEYQAKAVIIASGSHHRQLGLAREDEFTGNGVSYCALCECLLQRPGNRRHRRRKHRSAGCCTAGRSVFQSDHHPEFKRLHR